MRGRRPRTTFPRVNRLALVGPPLLFLAIGLAGLPADLSFEARWTLATTAWMALWWVSDAVPMGVTALVPTLVFPLLGILDARETARAYAHPMVFLFLGGFILARAMEVVRLHERIALWIVIRLGGSPARALLGFMVATAALSAWISNTAACVMMIPLVMGTAVYLGADDEGRPASLPLLLGVAYAASIGGLTTILGTPTNGILAGIALERYGRTIGFAEWLAVGLPVAAVLLAVTYVYLARVSGLWRRASGDTLRQVRAAYARLGPASPEERRVAVVFAAMALLWSTRLLYEPYVPLTDPGIAVAGAGLLFALPGRMPSGRLLDWAEAVKIPWGVLLLFAGGLALAAGFGGSGLADYLGGVLAGLGGLPAVVLLLAVVAFVNFLTEVTSNVATASVILPVLAAMADRLGLDPLALMTGATLAASCAFMLPMATGPNAVVFGSGELTVAYMVRRGFWLNLASIAVVVGWMWARG